MLDAGVDLARLVLDYLQTLIWPALVVAMLIRFSPYIWNLVQRASSGRHLQGGAGLPGAAGLPRDGPPNR